MTNPAFRGITELGIMTEADLHLANIETHVSQAIDHLGDWRPCDKCCTGKGSRLQWQGIMEDLASAVKSLADFHAASDDWRSDWRAGLSADLDKFARMLIEKRSVAARRTIKSALTAYREILNERIKSTVSSHLTVYSVDVMERGEVAACLNELFD